MQDTLLIRFEFWALVLVSLALPISVVAMLLRATVISRTALISCAVVMILLAGLDIGLLRTVMALARETPGMVDDTVFLSEYSVALYLLPYLGAGVGINLLTYAITQHLQIVSSVKRDLQN